MIGPRRLAPIAPLLVALAGCAAFLAAPTGDEALATWRTEASAIDAREGELQPVDGTWSRGDGEATWRAWFEDDELVLIRENLSFGDYGKRDAHLYFEDGVLRYYAADGTGIVHDAEGAQGMAPIRREVVFDSTGREVASRQETAGIEGPVDSSVVIGVRSHGAELKREAERLRPK